MDVKGKVITVKLEKPRHVTPGPSEDGKPQTPKANRSAGIVIKSPRLGLGQRSPTRTSSHNTEIQSLKKEEKLLLDKYKRLSLAKVYSTTVRTWRFF